MYSSGGLGPRALRGVARQCRCIVRSGPTFQFSLVETFHRLRDPRHCRVAQGAERRAVDPDGEDDRARFRQAAQRLALAAHEQRLAGVRGRHMGKPAGGRQSGRVAQLVRCHDKGVGAAKDVEGLKPVHEPVDARGKLLGIAVDRLVDLMERAPDLLGKAPVGGKRHRRRTEAERLSRRVLHHDAQVFPYRTRAGFQPALDAEQPRQLGNSGLGLGQDHHAFGMGVKARLARGKVGPGIEPLALGELDQPHAQRAGNPCAGKQILHRKAQ